MKKVITILAALAVSVSFATAADAAKKAEKKPGGGNPEERFKKLDTNGDGSITLDEFKASPMGQKDAAKAEEIFKKKDADGDGKLSMAEFSAGGGKKAAATAAAGATAPADTGAGKASTTTDAGKSGEKPGVGAEKK